MQGVTLFFVSTTKVALWIGGVTFGDDIRAATIQILSCQLAEGGTPRGDQIVADILANIANMPAGGKTLTMTESNAVLPPAVLSAAGIADATTLVTNHGYSITYWNGSANVSI